MEPVAVAGGEDGTVKKKSKFQILKTRLFSKKKKKKEAGGLIKQSQSASDIAAQAALRGDESGDDFEFSQCTLGSRALSHDSIFFANQSQTSPEPERVLSRENVHGRIRALQMKLQQQKMHLGPPPLLIPSKRTDDTGASSEDDGLPNSPPEISLHGGSVYAMSCKFSDPKRNHSCLSLAGTGSEEEEQVSPQPFSPPLSPVHSILAQSTSPTPPLSPGPSSQPPTSSLLVANFDIPAQPTSFLDNSAALHRLAIKPRNQRVSGKVRRPASNVHRPRSDSLNSMEHSVEENEELDNARLSEEMVHSYSSQGLRVGDEPNDTTTEEEKSPNMNTGTKKRTDFTLEQHTYGESVDPVLRSHSVVFLQQGLRMPVSTEIGSPILTSQKLQDHSTTNLVQGPSPINSQSHRDFLSNPGPRSSRSYTLPARSQSHGLLDRELTPLQIHLEFGAVLSSNNIDNLRNNFENERLASGVSRINQTINKQLLSSKTLPLRRTTSVSLQESPVPWQVQKMTIPSVASDDQHSVETGQTRPHSRSFQSTFGRSEQPTTKSEEHRPKLKPLNPLLQAKIENMETVSSSNIISAIQRAKRSEMIKPNESGQGRSSLGKVDANLLEMPKEAGDNAVSSCLVLDNVKEGPGGEREGLGEAREVESEGTTFGVKLRTTSSSLRYLSNRAKTEPKSKQDGADTPPISHTLPPLSKIKSQEWETSPTTEPLYIRPPLPRKPNALKSDTNNAPSTSPPKYNSREKFIRQGAPKPSAKGTEPETSWRVMAREKTKSLQQASVPSIAAAWGNIQGRTDRVNTLQEKGTKPDRGTLDEMSPPTAAERIERPSLMDSMAEVRKAAPGYVNTHRTSISNKWEPRTEDKFTTDAPSSGGDKWQKKTELSSALTQSLPAALPQGQPSWMELAKRKSLAWIDKTMD